MAAVLGVLTVGCGNSDHNTNRSLPSVPGGVIFEPANNSINMQWSASVDSENETSYYLSWKLKSHTEWSSEVSIARTDYTIDNLSPDTAYSIRLRAHNNKGYSTYITLESSTTAISNTAPSMPDGIVSQPSDDSITIQWAPAPSSESIMSYHISWKRKIDSIWNKDSFFVESDNYVITNLDAATDYDIRLKAKNNLGEYGACIAWVTTTTGGTTTQTDSAPSLPYGIVIQSTSDSIVVEWEAASSSENVVSYHISWKRRSGIAWGPDVSETDTRYIISGLKAGKDYNVRIRAKNAAGVYSSYISWIAATER